MVDLSVQVFPGEGSAFQNHIAVSTVFFWNGDGAGVQIEVLSFRSKRLPGRHVGMAVQEDVTRTEGRRSFFIIMVTVGQINQVAFDRKNSVIRHDRKCKDHLIDFRFAVSADTENFILKLVQHRNDFFWGIFLWQIIAWTVIKQITQEEHAVSLLPFPGIQHFFAKIC